MKISRIGLISRLGRIQITVEVYEELSKCKYLIKPLVYEIQQGNIGLAESSDYSRLQKKYQRLGIGELSVIASAKQKIAFIEDREAVNQASLNQKDILQIKIPPLPLQQEFVRIVEKLESMRQSQNQSKQQIEDLFSALMQKAFRGELDKSIYV
ncbi:MAG: hypothetical protein D4R88_00165 [Methanosarcinales archaeon]|nr:MAG: hypothetical protein D4R88_00165 [Methanosarcinales archaeon]